MYPDLTAIFEKGTADIEILGKRWRRTYEKNYDAAIRVYVRKGPLPYPSVQDVQDFYLSHVKDVIGRWMQRIARRFGAPVNLTDISLAELPFIIGLIPLDTEFNYTEFRALQKVIRDPEFLRSATYEQLNGKILMVPDDMFVFTYLKKPKRLPKAVWVR